MVGARFLVLAGCLAALAGPALADPVSFVGCRSDGQLGPMPAPAGSDKTPDVPAEMAGRLAWYASAYLAVLAPRGWHCFGLYGSNGASLMVRPEDFGPNPLQTRLTGAAVELSQSSGETSGRFEAAMIAARLFPDRRAFVDRVIAEGLLPRSDFPFGPFAHDRIHRLGANAVAFETPPQSDGMGTMSRLVKSADPIQGLAVMDEENDATLVVVRLGPAMRDLAPAIIKAARADIQP